MDPRSACPESPASRQLSTVDTGVGYIISVADKFCFQAPEIQTMYNMPMPISTIRTRIRQEFERQRYVSKLPVVDVLLFKGNAEYQVRSRPQFRQIPSTRGLDEVVMGTGDEDTAARLRSSLLKDLRS
jgi:hypothetical protein